jgi:hypothetical protein
MLISSLEFFWSGFYALYHHYQVVPMDIQRGSIRIKGREFKTARFQFFVIDDQSGIFHVQDFHDVLPSVDENKHLSTAYIVVHGRRNNAAQGIETFSHINRQGV